MLVYNEFIKAHNLVKHVHVVLSQNTSILRLKLTNVIPLNVFETLFIKKNALNKCTICGLNVKRILCYIVKDFDFLVRLTKKYFKVCKHLP